MSSLPLVSVHLVTYNSELFIKEALDSILAQDYPNFEIIVSDDASEDMTPVILNEYKKNHSDKITLFLNKVNQGVTKNCNVALRACRGKYVTFLGGDDIMLPHRLVYQVAHMEAHPECTISYHKVNVFGSQTDKFLGLYRSLFRSQLRSGDVSVLLKQGCFFCTCTVMVRKEKLPPYGFDEHYPVNSDFMLCLQALLDNGGEIQYVKKTLSRYRKHPQSVSSVRSILKKQMIVDALNGCNWIMLNYPCYAHLAVRLYGVTLKSLRKVEGISYLGILWQSFKIKPEVKVLLAMILNLLSGGKLRF